MGVSSRWDFIRGLGEVGESDLSIAGAKAANLGAMLAAGLPVPGGFVVTTAAYEYFVRSTGVGGLVDGLVRGLEADDAESVQAACAQIVALFEATAMPEEVASEVGEAYRHFGLGSVAVRSSGTVEDLPGASFAGQYETYLGISGADEVTQAVRRCWASLWTPRAVTYRLRQDVTQTGIAIAVVVQQLIESDTSGILFTANPLNGRRDQTLINASWGLGEAIVGGAVTPDQWILDKDSGAIESAAIADKQSMARRVSSDGDSGTETVPVPASLVRAPSLTEAQIAELVDLGSRIESHYRVPQDVEWAYSDGRLYLLQTRPITSLFPLPKPEPPKSAGLRVYFNVNVMAQGITEPLTPMGVDYLRLNYAAWTAYATGKWPEDHPAWAKDAAGRVFLDITDLVRERSRWTTIARFFGDKEPIGAQALLQVLESHADEILRANSKLRIPARLLLRLPGLLWLALSVRVSPQRVATQMVAAAEHLHRELESEADQLDSIEDRLRFASRVVYRMSVLEIRQLAVLSAMRSADRAEELLHEWFGEEGQDLVDPIYRALPGNPTTQMGTRLLQIAQSLRDRGVPPTLEEPLVADFLAKYGHRAVLEIDLGTPRWREEPGYVLGLLNAYMAQENLDERLAQVDLDALSAEERINEIYARVKEARGPRDARRIRRLLLITRQILGLRERPKFDMTRSMSLLRSVLKPVGEELASQGRLDRPEDIFFVTMRDVRSGEDLRDLAASNRAQHRRNQERRDSPRVMTSDGEAVYTVRREAPAGSLVGVAVSSGVYEGPAHVVHDPAQASLAAGEVLVTRSTDPAWTPLFLRAGALVMETGGPGAHGGIIAREYGIPAVAGVAGATVMVKTGQLIRVDGYSGTVTLL